VESCAAKAILLVDDEPSIIEALAEILTWEGFTVRSAADGRSALEALAAEPLPDLVLMDVMMPVMGGVDAAAAMRRDPRLRAIPVLLMTAGPLPPNVDGAMTLRKPFQVRALLDLIARALRSPPPAAG
jgi:CheY-like chemotaxis protein